MSKNNVRIAIRDSTDSHNVAFFDNQAGIKYKSANLQRFLAGSASILTIKYNSKDIDTIRSGCKLAFRYKNRDYWLNVMSFEKKGFEVELTAYSLGLELNNETRGEHKPANAMSIAEYVAYYDPEHALTIGVNEVSDKRIKLEWTGTGTILARLFSVANSFGAELDFSVELNDDYSLKRQVLNIYKKGNLGTNKVSQPVRVGKELKVINYSDNIKELRTAVRATGKDGLTIDGLDKKIYDNNKELLYYSSGMTVYAPQSRDRFPSVGKVSNDNWIVEDLGETQYETKEALWGYMYGEIQKKSLPEITYEVEGAIEAGIGDTQTLIDDIHFEPALYVQARVSELEDDILTGKVTKSTFINFERKYSQIADILLKQVEALAEDAAPYIIRLSTNNGYIFKNGEGSSTITARLEKYSKDIAATWKWVVDNKVVGTGDKLTVKAEQIKNTMAVTVIAYVNGNEVVRDYMTFSNSDDGVGVESIDRYFTSSDQSDGVTIEGAEWSDKPPAPTEDGKYLWAYDEITYTNGTVTTTKPSAVGVNFDVDAFRAEIAEDLKDVPNREEFENKISEELANSKAEIETQIETAKTQAESNAKEYADTINQETTKVAELANAAAGEIKADLVNVKNNLTATSLVANNAQASVDKAKQDLTNSVAAVNTKVDSTKAELTQAKQDLTKVTSDLNTAKQDLTNSVAAVNTKADSTKAELTQAKQDLTSHAQQLQTQANAQTELTKRVTTVETTANGTKTTVNELTKTVAQNDKDITSVTARTKKVEDDLLNTKTTLSQVKTTADSTSQKTATLETGLDGLNAKFSNLKIGAVNLLHNSKGPFQPKNSILDNYTVYPNSWIDMEKGKVYTLSAKGSAPFTSNHSTVQEKNEVCLWLVKHDENINVDRIISSSTTGTDGTTFTWNDPTGKYYLRVNTYKADNSNYAEKVQIEEGNLRSTYSQNEADVEQKVAEYKQNADQNYASLQTTVQKLDGTVQHNKTVAEQTAEGFKTRIESLETYKDGETTRANQYFESAKTETARQLTVERTAIAKDYVAKSTYTSDVAGIRNELSETTTTANTIKTNLANYQATNNRAVANLQSNIQTANGDISSLKTKVEAVPGQITSAVSAVESKIPTEIGGVNLLRNSKGPFKPNKGEVDNYVYYDSSTVYLEKNQSYVISGLTDGEFSAYHESNQESNRVVLWLTDRSKGINTIVSDSNTGTKGTRFTWAKDTGTYCLRVNTYKKVTDKSAWNIQVEKGNVKSDYAQSPLDTASDITKLSSEIKQTADGITLLATKTELNSAKTELQSGIKTATDKANSNAQTISTHTTQISALNTGLNAKVSQTDFNKLSGRVTTAENNITAKANELSSKITTVEGKIPTSVGARNLLIKTNQGKTYWAWAVSSGGTTAEDYNVDGVNAVKLTRTSDSSATWHYIRYDGLLRRLIKPNTKYTLSFDVKPSKDVAFTVALKRGDGGASLTNSATMNKATANQWTKVSCILTSTSTLSDDRSQVVYLLGMPVSNGNWLIIKNIKLEEGVVSSDWQPAPEDAISQISTLSSELKQTADGITLLATKTELNTAKNELQSGINTATNKANSAQNTANSAQNTANSNAQTISTHTTKISALTTGLNAKVSQTDFNTLSGRVTTAENNITAKANELSSKITTVEGKIPIGADGRNLWIQSKATGNFVEEALPDNHITGQKKCYRISNYQEISFNIEPDFSSRLYRKVTFSAWVKYKDVVQGSNNWNVFNCFKHSLYRKNSSTGTTTSVDNLTLSRFTGTSDWKYITYTYDYSANKSYDQLKASIRFNIESAKSGTAWVTGIKIELGSILSDYSPAPEDTVDQISTLSSELKQTTDSITASVQSLDNSTVKSSSLTINTNGVVIKAGKSPSDFANAIGSYFAVNQNAINLFSDKINVKGSMIVSGAITSDKIASKSINTAHLNGKIITADVISSNAVTADAIKAGAVTTDKMSANSINGDRITAGTLDAAKIKAGSISASQIASGTLTSKQIKAGAIKSINIEASAITSDKIASNSIDASKIVTDGLTANIIKGGVLQSLNGSTNFELDTGKLFYNNNNTGVFRVQNGASTMGLKFSNMSVTVNGTSRILSRVILGGDRRETTLDDGKWDKGGFSGIVIETIKGVEPTENEQADALRVIADNIYFTHTYSDDSLSARGWKMETYSPNTSYPGNVVLKPYGINYRSSDIIVGDLRLDNGDGSGYWMRATINVLKACFGHIVNGGISSNALNAIKSELNKISGT